LYPNYCKKKKSGHLVIFSHKLNQKHTINFVWPNGFRSVEVATDHAMGTTPSLVPQILFRHLYVSWKIGSDVSKIKDLCYRYRKLVHLIKSLYYQSNTFLPYRVSCTNVNCANSFHIRIIIVYFLFNTCILPLTK